MKNAQQRAGFKIFWRKSWKLTSSLSKSTKTTGKLCKVFTVWFPKELAFPRCRLFDLENQPPKFQHQISQRFLNGFSKFLMFWNEEMLLFKLSCISIYEIFR